MVNLYSISGQKSRIGFDYIIGKPQSVMKKRSVKNGN